MYDPIAKNDFLGKHFYGNAYSPLESSTNLTSKSFSIWALTNAHSISINL
jgi:hypothetical protein